MTYRTTQSTFEFFAPFSLPDFDAAFPAGLYSVTTEEEGVEVAGHMVYRRTATILRVEAAGRAEYHPVDPAELSKAIERDRETDARGRGSPSESEEPAAEPPFLQGKWPWRSIPKWVRVARISDRK